MEENKQGTEEIKKEVKDEKEVVNNNVVSKEEFEETLDRLKRVMAEFENLKKRASKEREMLYSSLIADIIGAFLPVIDNLEKAARCNN